MSLALLLAIALAPAPATGAPAVPPGVGEQEIVVTATRKGKCRIQRADQTLSDREFDKSAGEWASLGTPVRVVTPTRADYKCLARIVFRLNDRGVRLIHFVDRAASSDFKSDGTADDSEITEKQKIIRLNPGQSNRDRAESDFKSDGTADDSEITENRR